MNCRFEENRITAVDESGEMMAKADFRFVSDGVVDITHVYSNPELRGNGVAGRLMEAAVEYLRNNGLKAVASCSYANSWLQKNMDRCSDVIADGNDELPKACRIDGEH